MNDEKIENSDIHRINYGNKELIIIGTAHISKQSAELVEEVIRKEKPDTVCVELDKQRYKALSNQKRWENLDLKSIIKQKQLSTLIINILLSAYQKKLGRKLGVNPGIELLRATEVAKEIDIPIELGDRDVRITLKRAWRSMSLWQKTKFMTMSLASVFDKEEITEEQLEELIELFLELNAHETGQGETPLNHRVEKIHLDVQLDLLRQP